MRPGAAARVTRRELLAGAAAATGAAALSGCRQPAATAAGSRELVVWHSWGGPHAETFPRVIRRFEQTHPGIRIRPVFTPNNLSANQKFFTAVAAGTPPDVVFVDGPQVASWAERGSLTPLTDRLSGAGISEADYFPPTWRQNLYRDEVWAITYCADPNFGFAWNPELFEQAGLDPDRPPRTIAELTEFAHRTTRERNRVLTKVGIIPWAQYGPANSMFTWGWVFGGDFFDYETGKVTADDPKVVKALEWMVSFTERYPPERMQSMQQGIGHTEQDPFFSGRMAMRCMHISGVSSLERYAPDLPYRLTYIPAPPDGEARSSWVGGWCMSIPAGSRHPDDAWELIRWLCHDEEGTVLVGREKGLLPGMRRSAYFREVVRDPRLEAFVRILEESRHQRPVMPVQAFYMREMKRAVDAAVYGQKTPAEALADARKNTQAELDLVLAGS
ncbi:MAG: ABC transporter substrate-binding protein [Armatimonadota bacterium]